MPFGLPLAPRLLQGSAHLGVILAEPQGEAAEFADAVGLDLYQPWIQCFHSPLPHQLPERVRQGSGTANFQARPAQRLTIRRISRLQRVGSLQQHIAWRGVRVSWRE